MAFQPFQPTVPLWSNGPSPGALYNFPGTSVTSELPVKHTARPMVTGTSVLGITFNGGVMIAADTLGSYGTMARFRSISRLSKVNETTLVGASGDVADCQYVKSVLEQKIIDDEALDDGHSYTPKALFSYLTRLMYHRRSRINPLWISWVVGGYHDDKPFMGYVNMLGVAYESPTVATGYGMYIAQPLLREAYEKNNNMDQGEARRTLEQCLRVLYYRDCRTINKYEIGIVTAEGIEILGPLSLDTNWDIAHAISGYN
ncbi:proteasome subunit beta type-4-like [Dysidea avara]|uniref:proteasome subunit beta type-4-like n=1 Tax=Dysidea avara TaxID=196820 RepID=UPI00332B6E43